METVINTVLFLIFVCWLVSYIFRLASLENEPKPPAKPARKKSAPLSDAEAFYYTNDFGGNSD